MNFAKARWVEFLQQTEERFARFHIHCNVPESERTFWKMEEDHLGKLPENTFQQEDTEK